MRRGASTKDFKSLVSSSCHTEVSQLSSNGVNSCSPHHLMTAGPPAAAAAAKQRPLLMGMGMTAERNNGQKTTQEASLKGEERDLDLVSTN